MVFFVFGMVNPSFFAVSALLEPLHSPMIAETPIAQGFARRRNTNRTNQTSFYTEVYILAVMAEYAAAFLSPTVRGDTRTEN